MEHSTVIIMILIALQTSQHYSLYTSFHCKSFIFSKIIFVTLRYLTITTILIVLCHQRHFEMLP